MIQRKSARTLVSKRVQRLANLEARKPGSVRATPMLYAFCEALAR